MFTSVVRQTGSRSQKISIGATVIAIIAIAAYKLARSTNKRDPLLWGIFVVLASVTMWAQAELAEFFIFAGLMMLFVRA